MVTVGGCKLPPRFDRKKLSAAGPAHLALLTDHLDNDQAALRHYDRFMREVVAQLDNT